MPDMWRCTWEFIQQAGFRSTGWTWNLWQNGNVAIDTVATRIQSMKAALQKCVGQDTIIPWAGIRGVYQIGTKGTRIATTLYFLKPGAVTPPTGANDSDYPTTALLIEIKTAAGETVRQTIRAIPDEDVKQGGWWEPQNLSSTNVGALLQLLVTDQWNVYTQDPAQTAVQIKNFDVTTGFLTVANNNWNDGDIVKIMGRTIGIVPRLNGKWKLDAGADVNHWHLRGWVNQTAAQTGRFNSAFGQKYALTPKPIIYDKTKAITSQVAFVTEHRVGRPRKQPTGRRTIPH
jgi:hypothetical protein